MIAIYFIENTEAQWNSTDDIVSSNKTRVSIIPITIETTR